MRDETREARRKTERERPSRTIAPEAPTHSDTRGHDPASPRASERRAKRNQARKTCTHPPTHPPTQTHTAARVRPHAPLLHQLVLALGGAGAQDVASPCAPQRRRPLPHFQHREAVRVAHADDRAVRRRGLEHLARRRDAAASANTATTTTTTIIVLLPLLPLLPLLLLLQSGGGGGASRTLPPPLLREQPRGERGDLGLGVQHEGAGAVRRGPTPPHLHLARHRRL